MSTMWLQNETESPHYEQHCMVAKKASSVRFGLGRKAVESQRRQQPSPNDGWPTDSASWLRASTSGNGTDVFLASSSDSADFANSNSTDGKRYACLTCGKRFGRASYVRVHNNLVHVGERP